MGNCSQKLPFPFWDLQLAQTNASLSKVYFKVQELLCPRRSLVKRKEGTTKTICIQQQGAAQDKWWKISRSWKGSSGIQCCLWHLALGTQNKQPLLSGAAQQNPGSRICSPGNTEQAALALRSCPAESRIQNLFSWGPRTSSPCSQELPSRIQDPEFVLLGTQNKQPLLSGAAQQNPGSRICSPGDPEQAALALRSCPAESRIQNLFSWEHRTSSPCSQELPSSRSTGLDLNPTLRLSRKVMHSFQDLQPGTNIPQKFLPDPVLSESERAVKNTPKPGGGGLYPQHHLEHPQQAPHDGKALSP
ncbi:uncharacterized protein LOC128812315 isoform X2 [Vidua macroura]|uniref:uncharacterized protein LOC128812315 isoform X2 n=1 Tax=Vidua macroura TaxID=187451 RepID=UPI0023A88D18|nr:uncharacterized protein LOC128812315 isoform X2 [Vidua macroura]